MGAEMPDYAPGIGPGTTHSPQKHIKWHYCHPHSEGLVQTHAGSPPVSSQSVSSHLLLSAVSVLSSMILLTPLVHMIVSPSLQLNSRNSSQFLAVGHCISFHQLLDIGSMMTIGVVTNQVKGEDTF